MKFIRTLLEGKRNKEDESVLWVHIHPDTDYSNVKGVTHKTYNNLFELQKLFGWGSNLNTMEISSIRLVSMRGAPRTITERLSFYDVHELKSFEGFPKHIGSEHTKNDIVLNLSGCKDMTNLHNIHYGIFEINGSIQIPSTITSHILGLLKIKSLKQVIVSPGRNHLYLKEGPIKIINKHLDGKGNFFDCLEELEDAGLEEFAQL